jgi:hypothetical protein
MNQLEIEIGDTVSFLPHKNYNQCQGVCIDICFGGNGTYRISWDDYNASWHKRSDLTLIKKGKTMQFTKSDLKTGMFVKQRDGMYMLVLEDRAVGDTGFTLFCDVQESLLANKYEHLDIVAVYKASGDGVMTDYMAGNELNLIWERTEQTEAQKEMAILQEQAKALQEQITKLQGKL